MTNEGGCRIAAHAHIHLAPRAVAVKYTEMSTDSASASASDSSGTDTGFTPIQLATIAEVVQQAVDRSLARRDGRTRAEGDRGPSTGATGVQIPGESGCREGHRASVPSR